MVKFVEVSETKIKKYRNEFLVMKNYYAIKMRMTESSVFSGTHKWLISCIRSHCRPDYYCRLAFFKQIESFYHQI